ncbi:hypothetical protein HD806DRAFT_77828 [Xylariaceae sp. AK1471]|nr:hypothetical protein HD806DRAFT_77828 [Xylariaceae sp. AK1471]
MDNCKNITLIISSQSDIDNGPLSSCGRGNAALQLEIVGGEGTLNFTNITILYSVYIAQSPNLEVLGFPQLVSLDYLDIFYTTALNSLFAPKFIGANYESADGGFVLQIKGAPSLYNNLDLQIPTSLDTVNFWDFGETKPIADDEQVITNILLTNITQLNFLQTNDCYDLTKLEVVSEVHLTGTQACNYGLVNLKSVRTLNITRAANTIILGPFADQSPPSIRVNSSMSLSDTIWVPYNRPGFYSVNKIEFGRIDSIGEDLNISWNANLEINFDGLTSVGATLNLSNNANCTFNFDRVSQVADLLLLDNVNTAIPVFGSLQRAKNIHVRGFINTTVGSNLFPALTMVSGSLVIETLNPDFNCSKLVQQLNDGIISTLVCNGTNNGTDTTTAPKPSDGLVLSTGAYAGIGIGSGVILLGAIFAITWLVLHHRRSLKKLKTTRDPDHDQPAAGEDIRPPYTSGTLEIDGSGIVREKPDDPLTQLSMEERELPNDPLIELPIGNVALPISPQTLTSMRSSHDPLPDKPTEDGQRQLNLLDMSNMYEEGIPRGRPKDLLDRFPVGYNELPGHPHHLASLRTIDQPTLDDMARRGEEQQQQRFV